MYPIFLLFTGLFFMVFFFLSSSQLQRRVLVECRAEIQTRDKHNLTLSHITVGQLVYFFFSFYSSGVYYEPECKNDPGRFLIPFKFKKICHIPSCKSDTRVPISIGPPSEFLLCCEQGFGSGLDLDWIRIQSGQWIRIRMIEESKNDPQK